MPQPLVYCMVGNIPGELHSADLRAFFCHLAERGGFECFHYRHRPELKPSSAEPDKEMAGGDRPSTYCCVVSLREPFATDAIRFYHDKLWVTRKGCYLNCKVKISLLKLQADKPDCEELRHEGFTDSSTAGTVADEDRSSTFSEVELRKLPELRPPAVLPQGNVGTPSATLLQLIAQCRFPPRLISKLGLKFPQTRRAHRYASVPFDYSKSKLKCFGENTSASGKEEVEEVKTADGHVLLNRLLERQTKPAEDDERKKEKLGQAAGEKEADDGDKRSSDEESVIGEDDEHDAEEWERHEAFHDDVDRQGRTEERLFENEIELKWEKGGSGLVFYTDACYWDAMKGDEDERLADELDVDLSGFYHHDAGGRDGQDALDMEMERWRRGGENVSDWRSVAGFEKHTKGFGGRVLRSKGWSVGEGLGARCEGIQEPLEADGQHPRSKRGFGYLGEKLDRHPSSAKRRRLAGDVFITTVYDELDDGDSLLRSRGPDALKYRDEYVQFRSGGVIAGGERQASGPTSGKVNN